MKSTKEDVRHATIALYREGAECTASAIAAKSGYAKRIASHHLDKLVSAGLIKVTYTPVDPPDTSYRVVYGKGRKTTDEVVKAVRELDAIKAVMGEHYPMVEEEVVSQEPEPEDTSPAVKPEEN